MRFLTKRSGGATQESLGVVPPLSPQDPPVDLIAATDQRRSALVRHRRRAIRWGAWAVSLGLAWLLWDLLYRFTGTSGLIFTGPTATFRTLGNVIANGKLLTDVWTTTQEFLIASALAAVVGIVIGVVVGYFRPVGLVLEPWLGAGMAAPLVVLAPLFILWFGLGIWSKVTVAFLVMVFPMIVNTALGVSTVDQGLVDILRSMAASRWQIMRKVIVPASLPHITAGLQLSVGRGFTAVVVTELLGSTAGMGYRILVASQTYDVSTILAYVVVLSAIGAALMLGFAALDRRLAGRRG